MFVGPSVLGATGVGSTAGGAAVAGQVESCEVVGTGDEDWCSDHFGMLLTLRGPAAKASKL